MTRSPYRAIAADSRLESCWTLAEEWLSTCRSTHQACAHSPTPSWPTRLLDVDNLKIVDSEACYGDVRYVTLSYCWGFMPFTTLREDNLASFKTGIDLHTLPRTLQDAVYATKRLRVKYLWIDSLCIIQGLGGDFREEVPKMGKYYGDALVNLSALDANHANVGFLGPRQPEPSTNLQSGLHMRKARRPWSDILEDAPLAQRAWILQERMIAPRILHFSKSEIFWECQATSAREGSSIIQSEDWNGESWKDESFKRSFALDALIAENSNQPIEYVNNLVMNQWYRIVCQYSNLNLTVVSDVFPALAAIAQKFEQITDFSYVAGLWGQNLHRGLLWYASNALSKKEYKDIAPLWSWASHGGPVAMLFPANAEMRLAEANAEIISLDATFGENEFMGTHEATLQLRAHGMKVWCRSSADGHAPYSDPYLRMAVDIFDEDGIFTGTGRLDAVPHQSPFSCIALVICCDNHGDSGEGQSDTAYLLLVQVSKGCAERIGAGRTIDDTHGFSGKALRTREKELFLLV
jgi:hypothetical protein